MDDDAAGEIHDPHLGEPATAPHPVGHRRVDDDQPDGAEEQHGRERHPLRIGADDQRRGDDREGHLKREEHRLRDRTRKRVRPDSRQEGLAEAAYDRVCAAAIAEGQAIANGQPDDRRDAADRKTMHQDGEHAVRSHEPAIEQREPRQRHEQNQRRGRQYPRRIAAAQFVGGHARCGPKQQNGRQQRRHTAQSTRNRHLTLPKANTLRDGVRRVR